MLLLVLLSFFCFPHWLHSWYNSENSYTDAVWGLTSMYLSSTPDSDDGFSSMAASTAKEQTKEIGNCDMKRRMTTYPRKLPILVCLWLRVPLVHDHAVNQPQHDTIISISKLDIKQEYSEKIGHNWIRLVFIRNTENVLFTHGVYVPLFSSLY